MDNAAGTPNVDITGTKLYIDGSRVSSSNRGNLSYRCNVNC